MVNNELPSAKVVEWGWRGRIPFQGGGIPRIIRSLRPLEPAPNHVVEEDELGRSGDQSRDGHESVGGNQGNHEIVNQRRIAPHCAREAGELHRHEDAIDADETYPEVKFAQLLVHHPAKHLGKPVIDTRENAE